MTTKQTKEEIEEEYEKTADLALTEYLKIIEKALSERNRKLDELKDKKTV